MSIKKLGFGLMRLPLLDANDPGSIDMEQMKQMVDSFLEQGFTYFDTAWMYCGGKSEEAAREALIERHPRESFTLTTKLPAYMLKKEADREWLFNEQLRRTGAGYFDYYWLHDVNAKSVKTFDALRCWDFIREKKEAGLVRHIGFSYHDGPDLLDKILSAHPEIEYVQLQLNYLDWDSLGVQSHRCYDVATKHHKPVIVMEPVKGGSLVNLPPEADKILRDLGGGSNASYAIRFAASFPNMTMVLSGMSDMPQMRDNLNAMKDFRPLDETEMEAVRKVCAIFKSMDLIPCTGCKYCIEENECPKGILIPNLFAAQNAHEAFHNWNTAYYYSNILTGSGHGRASECIKCGKCEKVCPQHLEIRKLLAEVARTFE